MRIVYGFGPDLGEKAYGLFTDFFRMWRTRLTDDCLRILTGCGGRGLRIVDGFLPDVWDEACRLFTDLDRIWGRRLADCLWIWTGFGGEGLRIVYGFTDDCLRIFTGCSGRSLRIVYRFLPDLGKEACGLFIFTGLFTDFWMLEDEAYGLFTDFYRMWGRRRRLTDCLRIFTGCGGRSLRIVYGFLPDVEDELTNCLRIFTGCGDEGLRIVYGFLPDVRGRGLRV